VARHQTRKFRVLRPAKWPFQKLLQPALGCAVKPEKSLKNSKFSINQSKYFLNKVFLKILYLLVIFYKNIATV
jgi:hypothetical protein